MWIPMLDYHIIGSSSRGNAVRIGGIMIDCGMGFTDMKDDLYKCHSLLITHAHSDHIKANTLKQINRHFPWIKTYANSDVAYKFYINQVIGSAAFVLKGGEIVTPFAAVHDIPTTGFMIQMHGLDILYVTDTAEVNIPKEARFDYFFIESNYDESKLREIAKRYRKGKYDPEDSAYRHLSTQQAKGVYYSHRKSKDSQFIELHKSSRFY